MTCGFAHFRRFCFVFFSSFASYVKWCAKSQSETNSMETKCSTAQMWLKITITIRWRFHFGIFEIYVAFFNHWTVFFLLLFWLTRHNHTAHENLRQTQTFDHHLKYGSHHFYRRNSFFGSCCLFWIFFYMYLFSSFNYFSMFLSFFISFFFLLVSI